MVRSTVSLGFLTMTVFLTACMSGTPAPGEGTGDSASSVTASDQAMSVVRNVSYEGVVQPATMGITMQGTHQLELSDGRSILLSSENVDLNGYVNEKVRIVGSVEPTVEGSEILMRVDRIELLVIASSAPSVASSVAAQSASDLGMDHSVPASAVAMSEAAAPDLSAKIALMAEEDFSADQWTQRYCTAHIGFCVPVHRNWWYTSFGATNAYYWHVEVAPEAIEGLGGGPIAINLMDGDLAATGRSDSQVVVQGDSVIGYRRWTEDRHFEIRADAALEKAVLYMTEQLVEYNPES